jgi:parallel beta-helix repeat protein
VKTSALVVFLTAILICGLAVVYNLNFSSAQTPTEVIGIIYSDTTWTKANSPYALTGNVLIDTGVTVTVEADAVVNLNGYYIRVNGTLIVQPGVTINFGSSGGAIQVNGVMTARGTRTNPIHVNGAIGYWSWMAPPYYSSISFSQSSTGWNEQTGTGSIIENAILNSTTIESSSSIKISNNIINSGEISILDGSSVISGNSISSFIYIKGGGTTVISNNQITNGFILFSGEHGGESATITNNVISDAQTISGIHAGIWFSGSDGGGGNVLVERNLISDCGTGIYIFSPNVDTIYTALTVHDNTITGNDVGICVSNSYVPTLTGNNLQSNTLNVKLLIDYSGKSKDFDASNNWWGTTDASAIDKSIYDFNDDFDLGTVNYTPFLTEPNPQAMPDPNAPIPTPGAPPSTSPSPNPEPEPASPSPDQNSTTPEQPNNQNGTQAGLNEVEIAILAVLIVIAVSLIVLIGLMLKKRRQPELKSV